MNPIVNETPSPVAIGLRYGLLTGLVSVIISFGINALHMENSPAKWLTLPVLVGGIFLAQQEFKKRNGGFMSFGQGLGIGTVLSAVTGMLSAIFSYVYMTFIDPDMMARAMEKVRTDMEAKNMSAAQVDQAMAMSAKFTSGPIVLVSVVIGSIIIGFIISLIVSAFVKNEKPEFE
ncbi:MAG: DUF4199 domain-containing protein [Janthinobacterium lividum]